MPKRMSIDISGHLADTVDQLAAVADMKKSDIIRLALLFLHEVHKNEQAGGYLAEFDRKGNKTKLLLLKG